MREFTRGAAWWSPDGRALRADPTDRDRLPADTWERAGLPAGVRLEFAVCGVRAVEVTYAASPPSVTDSYRNAPPVFTLLADSGEKAGAPVEGSGTEAAGTPSQRGAPARAVGTSTPPGARAQTAFDTPAAPGSHVARIELPYPDGDFILHLPETLRPALTGLRPVGGGTIEPAARRPRWLVYGDSIAEGWSASRPHLAWPALAGRALGLDTVNLGYAGAARGEIASAQQLASLEADLITVAFGTNCWSRTPHSAGLLYETTRAFLTLVRRGHPETPLLVLSPVLRPDAESTPNALGATLAELRAAVERAAEDAGAALLPGGGLLEPRHLVDGVHPGDAGHGVLADAVASALLKRHSWAASS
ncbi:GDSL-type esterase/lipase family protein [Streptomyces sp. MZ04]|uniref:GDSL-type esterase/lipase family protein n=1 Tax=Streptomyces sp. MZ04 TaxID=2559236 RepID=UPI00107E7086|nr:GDSL-type esterase/lipase family protein [Streptomyces sp. MZ04]TGB14290.1 GDSL family lipase [Streptomyces sp. MZ04]